MKKNKMLGQKGRLSDKDVARVKTKAKAKKAAATGRLSNKDVKKVRSKKKGM